MPVFKSYDVRGTVGVDLDAGVVRGIGAALVGVLDARRVVIGRDARPSSPELAEALAEGLTAQGAEVADLGLCGTEEIYHATARGGFDAGVMVTASHNPAGQNGLKLIGAHARPLDAETFAGLREASAMPPRPKRGPRLAQPDAGARAAYVETLLGLSDPARFPAGTIVVNAGNGAAGPTFDALAAGLARRGAKSAFARINHDPDPSFPNGVPNPMLPENRPATSAAVRARGAVMGVAWDGDFDRCFLFDDKGGFVPGEIVICLLATAFLQRHPGATVVHDTRAVLAVRDAIETAGGRAVMSATGHARMKETMRREAAIYGGEVSAHHYFRDFFYCDSGMLPWMLVAEQVGRSGRRLSEIISDQMRRFPSSGELNFTHPDPAAAVAAVHRVHGGAALAEDRLDGLSLEFAEWRMSLRPSHTEPLLRLIVEGRGDAAMVEERAAALTRLIRAEGGAPAD